MTTSQSTLKLKKCNSGLEGCAHINVAVCESELERLNYRCSSLRFALSSSCTHVRWMMTAGNVDVVDIMSLT